MIGDFDGLELGVQSISEFPGALGNRGPE